MQKKKIIYIICIVFALSAVWTLIFMGGIIMKNGGEAETEAKVQYLIILGCKLEGDQPGRCLQARIDRAAEYLLEHPDVIAIGSGGQGSNEAIPEGKAIKNSLLQYGIGEERILVEDRSTSTYENFVFTKQILDEREKGKAYNIAFVTNDFHLYRSRYLAKYVGFSAVGLSAPTPRELLLPNLIREICSVLVAAFRFRS